MYTGTGNESTFQQGGTCSSIMRLLIWPHDLTERDKNVLDNLLYCLFLFSFPPFFLVFFLLFLNPGSTFLFSYWCWSLALILRLIYSIFLQYIKQYPPVISSSAQIDPLFPKSGISCFLRLGWGIWNPMITHFPIHGTMPGTLTLGWRRTQKMNQINNILIANSLIIPRSPFTTFGNLRQFTWLYCPKFYC